MQARVIIYINQAVLVAGAPNMKALFLIKSDERLWLLILRYHRLRPTDTEPPVKNQLCHKRCGLLLQERYKCQNKNPIAAQGRVLVQVLG